MPRKAILRDQKLYKNTFKGNGITLMKTEKHDLEQLLQDKNPFEIPKINQYKDNNNNKPV